VLRRNQIKVLEKGKNQIGTTVKNIVMLVVGDPLYTRSEYQRVVNWFNGKQKVAEKYIPSLCEALNIPKKELEWAISEDVWEEKSFKFGSFTTLAQLGKCLKAHRKSWKVYGVAAHTRGHTSHLTYSGGEFQVYTLGAEHSRLDLADVDKFTLVIERIPDGKAI